MKRLLALMFLLAPITAHAQSQYIFNKDGKPVKLGDPLGPAQLDSAGTLNTLLGINPTGARAALGFGGAPGAPNGAAVLDSAGQLSGKSADVFKARYYGSCTWDATHDVSPCVQLAITAASSAGGGMVELPAGFFGISSPITSPATGSNYSQVTLFGQPYATSLRPIASMAEMVLVTTGLFDVSGVGFVNNSSYSPIGILYNKTPNNIRNDFKKNSFAGFVSAIQMANGDNFDVSANYFVNNTTAINFTGFVLNGTISKNYVLGGNGWDIGDPASSTGDVEGVAFNGNIVLPASSGDYAVRIRNALTIKFSQEVYDQNNKSGANAILLDATAAGSSVRDIKFSDGWMGGGTGSGSAIKAIGGVSDIRIGGRVQSFGAYCLDIDGTPGFSNAININGLSCFSPGIGDLKLGNVQGVISNSWFTSLNPVTDTVNTAMIVSNNSFVGGSPHHIGSVSRYTFNYGDTGQELITSGAASSSGSPIVNSVKINGAPTGGAPSLIPGGAASDVNASLAFGTKGTGDFLFYTDLGGATQSSPFVVQHSPNATSFESVSAGNGIVLLQPNSGGGNADQYIRGAGTGSVVLDQRVLMPTGTPSSSSASCRTGQLMSDVSYIYVCTGTNTWKRSALLPF